MTDLPAATGVHIEPGLPLDLGGRLAPARLSWCRYGPEPAQASRVVLFLHGISASPQALPIPGADPAPDAGWGAGWIGPGRHYDTRDCCVLVPNALGSCFGSSGPSSQADPAGFPAVTIGDTVRLQGRWLASLGISRLDEVIGYSYGGYQAFQWAVAAPADTSRVVVLASGPAGNGTPAELDRLRALARAWQAGEPQARAQWQRLREATLTRYGQADWLAASGVADPAPAIAHEAARWTERFSPWSLAALRKAAMSFDVRARLPACRTPVRWLLGSGDRLFPPEHGLVLSPFIRQAVVHGRAGHLSPMLESAAWQRALHA
ncbi:MULTISPECIES: alpha/beta fold hydrolase [Pigmentiphaga]|uniref:Homoserine O-acetyltransferase n=1 Tax=Pigmentiphaga daeguensis TaxID=414049 RepID=A0ABN1BG92_9BURK|nr:MULTISPECIES: alpha/beta fold hydrolase [unclassified Pigmentiphaga]OVZ65028.1 hypothetical protein CDO46_06375 [Pigmentiphaga sp. NML030171]